MIFTETKLKGAFVVDIERRDDSRGFFARMPRSVPFSWLKAILAWAMMGFNPCAANSCAAGQLVVQASQRALLQGQ